MDELAKRGFAPERCFIKQPAAWLNGHRWEDWREGPPAIWADLGSNGKRAAREASLREAVARYTAENGEYGPGKGVDVC